MNEILKIVLSLSLSGSILIAVCYLLRPLFKERLSKRWQYYIWLLVVARLLLPFAPETNLMGTLFQGMDKGMEQMELGLPADQGVLPVPENGAHQSGDMGEQQGGLGNEQPAQAAPVGNTAQNVLATVLQNLWLGWLIIALILFVRKITVYQSFVKYIRAGCKEVADIDVLERFGKLVDQYKIKTTVELYTNNLISSPLLIGFFRPCIVLPSADLPTADFDYTILHELTHYKRRDMFYKWLVQFSICVHWFNPLVYLMGREVSRACELSCDEAVIESLDAGGRRAYGDTLINAMGDGGNYKDSFASVTLTESAELLKERLNAIMKFKKTTRLTAAVSIVLACLLFFSAAVLGACSVNPPATETTSPSASEEKTDTPYSAYSEYGIMYDEKTDSLFYNNERIRYFEDNSTFYNGDNTISGSLFFHTDQTGDGNVDVYTVRDSQNELTGIRAATEDEFMQKSGAYESTNQSISDYKKYGVNTDAVGNIYFEDFLVRELYDPVAGTIIQENSGAGFPKDSIDIEAVYEDGVLSGLRIVSEEEYNIHTRERIEAVQDFWVEQQKQRE